MAFIFFTVGRKGSGKSLFESRRALSVMNGYLRTEKKYPQLPKRIYFSKQKFAERIERKELVYSMSWQVHVDQETKIPHRVYDYDFDDKGNKIVANPKGHLFYWSSAYDLLGCPRVNCWRGSNAHPLHNADVFWDEIADDIPREKWNELPEDLKQVFSHARKRAVRIFANTQKYEMVAVDFRRQCDQCVWLVKIIGSRDIDVTRPHPKLIYVLQLASEFDPLDMENENDPRNLLELRVGWPKIHWYTKKDVSVFDTEWEVPPTKYTRVREVKHVCIEGEKCSDPTGRWHLPKHEKI